MIFAMNKQSSSISRARSDLTRRARRTKLCKVRSLAIKGDSNYVVKAAAATATTKINQTFQDAEKATKSPRTAEEIKLSIQRQIATGTIPAIPTYFDNADMYQATAQAAREQLAERWNDTYAHFHKENPKQAYYISMEFLQGRALTNAIGNMGMTGAYSDALRSLGYSLEECAEEEKNMGLGNGGLGRLAACFLDSIATLSLPAWGYGMRYKYGLFKQAIDQQTGQQMEYADDWLVRGNPWEIPRPQIKYPISFYGEVTKDGKWIPGKQVDAVAYDTPIPGYGTKNCISLRLWDAQPIVPDFNLTAHNAEDYQTSMGPTNLAQQIMAVLYPGDATKVGKALRLSQQYMLCSASVQDILMRFKERGNTDWQKLPEKVCVQMNDTHPTLAAPELMRLLMDQEGMKFDAAWELTKKTVAYTNHTVMPEALEKWPLDLMEELLPRHMQIIRQIDQRFIEEATAKFAGKKNEQEMAKFLKATTILENVYHTHVERPMMGDTMEKRESPPATVRMANLCCIAGLSINGVAQIHSDIVKSFTFKEFAEIYGHKFQNKTNGVTPRRWLAFCNPELSKVITKWCGSDKWITDTEVLRKLMDNAKNPELQKEWKDAKIARKQICKDFIKAKTGIDVPADAMFDIQVKRIHEYKRQLLNILGIIYRYRQIKAMSKEERKKVTPRVCVFGGKAYATYIQAKRIVRLVTAVGDVVNNDPEIGDLMKVVFVPDYNVSVAETLIPASELSQHISTAGTEASGTSNMKFQMNGCLIIGTLDGANVEIRECVGDDNFFLFGIEEDEVEPAREERANGKFQAPQSFLDTIQFIRSGAFGKPGEFEQLLGSLEGNSGFGQGDYFLVGKDFQSYIECQAKVDVAYKNQERWTESSILSTATSGKFNSDRTIDQYAKEIWGIKKCVVP